MKKLIVNLGKFMLNVIYAMIKVLPVKKQIVWMSMQSNTPSLDFLLLQQEIKQKDATISQITLCKKMESSLHTKKEYLQYAFHMVGYLLKAMYYLGTSKICVTESYCVPISILKHRKQLKIVQIWHASGAVKKFGYQCLDTKEGKSKQLADLMCMHQNYDYAIAPSELTRQTFSEAFGMDKEKIVKLGLPRLEYLTNPKFDRSDLFYKEYPSLKNKKIILYVPTFRKGEEIDLSEIVNYPLDQTKYQLIIKLHPLEKTQVPEKYQVDPNYSSFDLIKVADYIITDYSILSIEASILDKPIFLYLYDLEEYRKNRGLNIDLQKELKTFTSKHFSDIMQKIETNDYNIEELRRYQKKYIEIEPSSTIEKLTNFILTL